MLRKSNFPERIIKNFFLPRLKKNRSRLGKVRFIKCHHYTDHVAKYTLFSLEGRATISAEIKIGVYHVILHIKYNSMKTFAKVVMAANEAAKRHSGWPWWFQDETRITWRMVLQHHDTKHVIQALQHISENSEFGNKVSSIQSLSFD